MTSEMLRDLKAEIAGLEAQFGGFVDVRDFVSQCEAAAIDWWNIIKTVLTDPTVWPALQAQIDAIVASMNKPLVSMMWKVMKIAINAMLAGLTHEQRKELAAGL